MPTVTQRIQETNGCWWCLQQLQARLKCKPSWTLVFHLDSHAYPPTLLPIWIPDFPLNGCFYHSKEKLSGGFRVEFSIDGGSLIFPLRNRKGRGNRFPARCYITMPYHWQCVVLRSCLFHFCWCTQPEHHTVPVTVHLLCWQLLGTQISLPVKNRLCCNCHILRCTDLLHLAVHSLRSSSVYCRWNTETMPLYGMQRYWSTWPSMMQTALFTRSGTLLRTEDMGSHFSTAAHTETFSRKGKGCRWRSRS